MGASHVYTYSERRKLCDLINTYLAVRDVLIYHADLDYGSLEGNAEKSGWWFDWEPVLRVCFPEVLIIMSGDRREEQRRPVYAVVPRVGDWIELSCDPKRLADLVEDIEPQSSDGQRMMETLRELRSMSHSLPTERVGEAMKHLNALQRLIRPTA